MFNNMFDNVGASIKTIAKVLFYFCFSIGAIVIVIGILKFLCSIDEYTTFSEALGATYEDAVRWESLYADSYYGKVMIKTGFICLVSSFGFLFTYGFGELIECCQKIYRNMK